MVNDSVLYLRRKKTKGIFLRQNVHENSPMERKTQIGILRLIGKRLMSVICDTRVFSGDNTWGHLVVGCICVSWIYLFFPFRLSGKPIVFDQMEEWTLSIIMLSVAFIFLFVSGCKKEKITFRITIGDILIFLYISFFVLTDAIHDRDFFLPCTR